MHHHSPLLTVQCGYNSVHYLLLCSLIESGTVAISVIASVLLCIQI